LVLGNGMKKSGGAVRPRTPGKSDAQAIDFDELPGYVGYQVRRAQARIFSEFEGALRDFDFTPGSFGVLTLIRANPGITQVALAAAFGVDKSTMSPVIFRLEQRGLVRREVLARDRRRHALFFEASKEATYLSAQEKVRIFEERVAARLTKAEQRELARLLVKLQAPGPGRVA